MDSKKKNHSPHNKISEGKGQLGSDKVQTLSIRFDYDINITLYQPNAEIINFNIYYASFLQYKCQIINSVKNIGING